MKKFWTLSVAAIFLASCSSYLPPMPDPYYPAPIIHKGDGVKPPSKKTEPLPSSFTLPNGVKLNVLDGTQLLSSCAVFGIPATSKKPTYCVAIPASMADGRGGGQAQNDYANLLRSAGYAGRSLPLRYRDRSGCRQHVMLSTFPATIQRDENWSGAKDYVVFMEFTPLTCPES